MVTDWHTAMGQYNGHCLQTTCLIIRSIMRFSNLDRNSLTQLFVLSQLTHLIMLCYYNIN